MSIPITERKAHFDNLYDDSFFYPCESYLKAERHKKELFCGKVTRKKGVSPGQVEIFYSQQG